jgi:hypothetical protein
MITMFCDRCGDRIPQEMNGGVRLRTANKEFSFHLCSPHQDELRELVKAFCETTPPRDVKTSLSLR